MTVGGIALVPNVPAKKPAGSVTGSAPASRGEKVGSLTVAPSYFTYPPPWIFPNDSALLVVVGNFDIYKVGFNGSAAVVNETNYGDLSLEQNAQAQFIVVKKGTTPSIVGQPGYTWKFNPVGFKNVLAVVTAKKPATPGAPVVSVTDYNNSGVALGPALNEVHPKAGGGQLYRTSVRIGFNTQTVAGRDAAWANAIKGDITNVVQLGGYLNTPAGIQALQDYESGVTTSPFYKIIAPLLASYHQLQALQAPGWSEAEINGNITWASLMAIPSLKALMSGATAHMTSIANVGKTLDTQFYQSYTASISHSLTNALRANNGLTMLGANNKATKEYLEAPAIIDIANTGLANLTKFNSVNFCFNTSLAADRKNWSTQYNVAATLTAARNVNMSPINNPTVTAHAGLLAAIYTNWKALKTASLTTAYGSISIHGGESAAAIENGLKSDFGKAAAAAINFGQALADFSHSLAGAMQQGVSLMEIAQVCLNAGVFTPPARQLLIPIMNLFTELDIMQTQFKGWLQQQANNINNNLSAWQSAHVFEDNQRELTLVVGVMGVLGGSLDVVGKVYDVVKNVGDAIAVGTTANYINAARYTGFFSAAVAKFVGYATYQAIVSAGTESTASQWDTAGQAAFLKENSSISSLADTLNLSNSVDFTQSQEWENFGNALKSMLSFIYSQISPPQGTVAYESAPSSRTGLTPGDCRADYRAQWRTIIDANPALYEAGNVYYFLGHADFDVDKGLYDNPYIDIYKVSAPVLTMFPNKGFAGWEGNGTTT